MIADRIQAYVNQIHQKPSPRLRAVLDKYWAEFAMDASDAINAIGVVPYIELVTHDGYVVPRVLKAGTYNIRWKYDIQSEGLDFEITRSTASGVSFVNQQNASSSMMDDTFQIDTNQMSQLLNGDSSLNSKVVGGDISGADQTPRPSAKDPHVYLTRRLDMGSSVPSLGEVDPCCMVLSGFGFDPSLDGCLNSNAAALWPEYIKTLVHEYMNVAQESRITQHVPFAEVAEPSSDYVNSLTSDVVGPTTLEQAFGDNQGIHRVMLSQEEVTRREMLRNAQRSMNAAKHTASLNLPDLQDILQQRPAVSYERLREFMKQTYVDSVQEQLLGQYELLQPGARLASYAPHASSTHMPLIIQLFHTKTSAQYRIPIAAITQRTSAHGDTTQQREAKYEAVNSMVKQVSNVMTTIFRTLYGETEVMNAFSFLYDRFLSTEAVDRLMQNFDAACESEALKLVLRSNRLNSKSSLDNIQSTSGYNKVYDGSGRSEFTGEVVRLDAKYDEQEDTKAVKRKRRGNRAKSNTGDGDADVGSDSESDAKSKRKKKGRQVDEEDDDESDKESQSDTTALLEYDAHQVTSVADAQQYSTERCGAWLHLWLQNPDDVHLLSQTLQDVVNEPDPKVARVRLRMLYMTQLRQLTSEDRRKLFLDGDVGQREWFAKQETSIRQRASKASDIQLAVVYSAPIDLSQLTFMATLGLINSHEFVQIARSRYMLPVQCDTEEAQKQTKILKQMTDFMSSSQVQAMISDTPMGVMMKAVEGKLFTDQQKLSGENAQLQDQLEQQRIQNAIDKAVHRAILKIETQKAHDADEKSAGGGKSSSATKSAKSTSASSGASGSSTSSSSTVSSALKKVDKTSDTKPSATSALSKNNKTE